MNITLTPTCQEQYTNYAIFWRTAGTGTFYEKMGVRGAFNPTK